MSDLEVRGTCHHDCPDSCGWIVTVSDGVATRLQGNPEHPFSAGELCPKVNRFLDRVYSPERIVTPLRRVGPKGAGEFEPTGWDEALATIAERVGDAISRHGGETVWGWWDAGNQGALSLGGLHEGFFARLGASRTVDSLCGAAAREGMAATCGSGRGIDPLDLRHSRLILLWGTNTRLTNRHLWPTLEAARAEGATVVVIDPVRTITAASADWFIQPRPGTDVALMLAMMSVLVRDDLVDRSYVDRHTVGFEQLAARVAEWPPERAAAVCGLDVGEIERLAAAWGTVRPAAVRTLIGAEHREHGAMFFRALACLPTLVGAWRDRGGGLARSTGTWTEATLDAAAVAGAPPVAPGRRSLSMNHIGRVLTDPRLDPPVTVLVAWNGNPAVTAPNAEVTRRGLSRDDLFTVVHEQFLTDTARYADVVLPATTQIEQLDVVPAWGSMYLGLNRPAIDPVGESVSNTELFRRLSSAMGVDDPELRRSDEELLAAALGGQPQRVLDELEANAVARIDLPEDLRPYAEGGFATPSGKAELYSERLAAAGHDPLPAYHPPAEGPGSELAERFPLVLLTPKTHLRFLNSSYPHLPRHGPPEGGPYVELHADDAAARDLAEGDAARVHNDRGELEVPVRISTRLRPGVAAVPFGWWRTDHGGDGSANSLTNDALTDWGGGVAFSDTLVEVSRP